jgi:cytochrome b6-f complex iron-sulfur subunit
VANDDDTPRVSRRAVGQAVLGTATAGYATAIGYPIVRYLASGAADTGEGTQVSEVSLGNADDLKPNTGKNFAFGSRPGLVIKHADDTLVAFVAICSHLGCTVAYEPSLGKIKCPCHGGEYDSKTGKNVGGPPPKPLEPLPCAVEGGKLIVRKGS